MADDSPTYPNAPISEEIENPNTGQPEQWPTTPWRISFRNLRNDINAASRLATPEPVTVPDSTASIGATTILTPISDGLFSFEYYAAITTVAVTSSSLTVTAGWTDAGVSKSKTFTAITGNLTTTTGSERYVFRADADAPITYATTYASNGAGEMHYRLDLLVSTVGTVS